MSDLIRRDDVLRSIEEWYGKLCKPESITGLADVLAGFSAYKEILMIPVVDAVAVVRCGNCKYFMAYRCEIEGRHGDCYIRLVNSYEDQFVSVANNDFCSHGERREDDGIV